MGDEKTYQVNNILGQIEDFDIDKGWPTDDPNISKEPFGKYKVSSLPEVYSKIQLLFNFGEGIRGEAIYFEWQPNSNITIGYTCHYNQSSKVFTKEINILEEPRKAGEYIEDEDQVKAYLKEYNISSDDLDKHYDEIVNQKVLPDW